MSQKRMFDKAIVDTDRFMDLPISCKALYFLLGMEADDEGFVSYKKIIKIHGGSDDDVAVLIGKNFIIKFPSGVVVITDWNKNNYLDANRIKPTEYQPEKKMLELTNDKRYVLNTCLTSIEESRVEESSIVEYRGDTPSQIAKDFFLKGKYYKEYLELFNTNGNLEFLIKELDKFILYWTEPNATGNKQRWQKETTFEVKRRLTTWLGKVGSFTSGNKKISKIL